MFKVPEEFRIRKSKNLASNTTSEDGNKGAFAIKKPVKKKYGVRNKFGDLKEGVSRSFILYMCTASDGMGWEHVGVSLPLEKRLPTWDEMCDVKTFFWDSTDMVIQYHPAEKDYVNNHSRVLHLWRPIDQEVPKPPPEMIGIKSLGTLE